MIHVDKRLDNIANYVRLNWNDLAERFENFYKYQKSIKTKEVEEIEEFRNVISTNQINLHLFYRKYSKTKDKIKISENLPSYSYIIKNEEHFEKAVLTQAARFNEALEAIMKRVQLEHENRQIKEQVMYYEQAIEFFEQTKLQKKLGGRIWYEIYVLNIGVVIGVSIGFIIVCKILALMM